MEKVLIKSEPNISKKLLATLTIVCLIILAVVVYCCYQVSAMAYNTNGWIQDRYANEFAYFLSDLIDYMWSICLIPIILAVIFWLTYLWFRSFELTVTDKRIYGKTAWGNRVDLPVDSISAIATLGLKGVVISTSSGKISFRAIRNANEIYEVINNLLIGRQNQKTSKTTVIKQEIPQSNADELKKYKELLDMGVITQEEFDAKKKQLLGL